MMKTTRFLLAAVPYILFHLGPGSTASERLSSPVVINEVYYDHPGSDTGHEFVELFSHGTDPVILDGWSLVHVDGLSGSVRELWRAGPETIIPGGGFLLIGCDSCAAGTGQQISGSLENGPDAVVLLYGSQEADLVGYGGEGPALRSEGSPCPDCDPGLSLSRRPDGIDSGDNLSDFAEAAPTPGARNFYQIDLAVSRTVPLSVHCPFGETRIDVLLINAGLSEFAASAVLTIMSIQDGLERIAGRREICPRIDAGDFLIESLTCIGLPAGKSRILFSVEAKGDLNPANDSLSACVASSPGRVVVNEIMYRAGYCGEWIELVNRSGTPVDLSGWTVSDMAGATGSIDNDVTIDAGSFVVLAQDLQAFFSCFSTCEGIVLTLVGSWPRLNDGTGGGIAETVFIRSGDCSIVESVSYEGLCGEERDRSIERISPDICSADPAGIWLRCGAEEGATPGCENYCNTDVIPAEGMDVSPDPFCPERDCAVKFVASAFPGEGSFRAGMYDMEGREIRKLPSGPIAAPVVSFIWDGSDGRGRSVGTGLYICVVEFICGGGGVCRREKRTVTVWAEP